MEEEFNKWYKENKRTLQSDYMIGDTVVTLKAAWNAAIEAVKDALLDGGMEVNLNNLKVREE